MDLRCLCVAASAVSICGAAAGYMEPVYVVTTSGDGTNSLASATVVMTVSGESSEVAFSELSLSGGTFVKRGSGWLQSSDAMASFTGELVVEQGAFIVSKTGQSGAVSSGNPRYGTDWTGCAHVVVSNGATFVIDNSIGLPTLKQPFTISGTGYKGLGAVLNDGNSSGSSGNQLFYSQITLSGNATICHGSDGGRLGMAYSILNLNGHTLMSKSVAGRGIYVLGGLQVTNPGHIVFDSTLAQFNLSKTWEGTTANTVTFTNNAYLRMNNFGGIVNWTAVNSCDNLGADALAGSGVETWSNPDINLWHGPFRLDRQIVVGANSRPKHSMAFVGAVGGDAGITLKDHWLRLRSRNNTFKGGVDVRGGGHLVLSGNGSLPARGGALKISGGGEFLFDETRSENMKLDTMEYPVIDWSVAEGEAARFPYTTNSVIAGLVKRGGGVLDVAGRVSVTGVTEVAAGVLRIPFEQAGLCEGWVPTSGPYGTFDNGAKMLGNLECIVTNRIALGADLAYTTNAVLWQRSPVQDWSLLLSYHGYVWNRSGSNATWVFAQSMYKGSRLYIDGNLVTGYETPGTTSSEVSYYHSSDNRVAFYTVMVSPGPHRIDMRTYTQSSNGIGRWGPCQYEPANATWKANFGWAVDWNGTMSTDCADYSEIRDPGDGSLFTVTTNGMDVTLASLVPSFAHLKFTGGVFDARGSDVRVPVLEGADGTVTNSNVYAADGVLTVGRKWLLAGGKISNKRLKVFGKMRFADGVRVLLSDAGLLPHGEYVIATATGGFEGVPAQVEDEDGPTHWKLAVDKGDGGNDMLRLYWNMGLVVSFR